IFATLLARYGTLAGALAPSFAGERMLPGLPGYSDAEIDYLIAHEQVETLADLALRRTVVALAGGLDAAALEALADRLAAARGWSAARRGEELHRFRVKLATDHGADPERIGLHRKGEVAAQ
ncbi:glycerol-3-phosphate dehydrogenase, partial [Rhodovulum sulfidophilum]|nr:glycerol-3-phosphate dehydrogenase [Rhodovulum sulfidophilum]